MDVDTKSGLEQEFRLKAGIYQATKDQLKKVVEECEITEMGDLDKLDRIELILVLEKWLDKEKGQQDKGVTARLQVLQALNLPLKEETSKTTPPVKTEPLQTTSLQENQVKAAFRKDFKISGSVDFKQGITFVSLVRQMERGQKKGYSDLEIIDAVIKAVPGGSGLRSYLEGRGDLTLPSLRQILRAHYKEQSPTELFNKLGQISQNSGEDCNDFLMRALEVRQKVLFTSQEEKAEVAYDRVLVDRLFARAIHTGLKSDVIRMELKPVLEKHPIEDEKLLQIVSTLSLREQEHETKQKKVNTKVNVVVTDQPQADTVSKESKQVKEGILTMEIKQLRAEVASLKEAVNKNSYSAQTSSSREQEDPKGSQGRCKTCQENSTQRCTHCWVCGSEEHWKAGCRQRRNIRQQGNFRGSRLSSTNGHSSLSFAVNEVILGYAEKGISYKTISHLLQKKHGELLSPNAVKKRMHRIGFPRRKGPPRNSKEEIKRAIEIEQQSKPESVGYRNMTDILRMKGYDTRRDIVMELMREIDPEGCKARRRRRLTRKIYRSQGPNQAWHVDGYDKLKPYGIAIHGCIDGYSRKILWLYAGPSNNDPHIIATYYLKCVAECNGCPVLLQADPGTENSIIGPLQAMFRNSGDSFRIVKSAFNQRIEAWWSMFRRRFTSWWMDMFKDLESFGHFDRGNDVDICCLRFCFTAFIQNELDDVKDIWNNHHISHSRQATVPNGKPIVLYDAPELTGGIDCLVPINMEDFDWVTENRVSMTISGCAEFDAKATEIFYELNIRNPNTWEDCVQNYFRLKDEIRVWVNN